MKTEKTLDRRQLLQGLLAMPALTGVPPAAIAATEPRHFSPAGFADCLETPRGFTLLAGRNEVSRYAIAMQWAADLAEQSGADSWFVWNHTELESITRLVPPEFSLSRSTWTKPREDFFGICEGTQMIARSDRNATICLLERTVMQSFYDSMIQEHFAAGHELPGLLVADLGPLNFWTRRDFEHECFELQHHAWTQFLLRLHMLSLQYNIPVVALGELLDDSAFDTWDESKHEEYAPLKPITPRVMAEMETVTRYFDRVITVEHTELAPRSMETSRWLHEPHGCQVRLRLEQDYLDGGKCGEALLTYNRA